MKISSACAHDLESTIKGIGLRSEGERELFVHLRQCGEGNGLPVVCARSPDQADLNLGTGGAAKVDSTCIRVALDQSEAGLPDAVRRGGIQLNARALIADKRLVFIHHHNFVGTHGAPFTDLPVAGRAALRLARWFGLLGYDWKVEFPVIEHFRP